MNEKFDFGGWATRNDIRCADGRTIRKDAFIDNDGSTVPLVWNHGHSNVDNVLGHAVLENRDEGVYAYCKFNSSESGKNGKILVEHGDIVSLSIYANKLQQTKGGDVLHGSIREVSLVLAGANPGAYIDNIMVHGEETPDEAFIWNGSEDLDIYDGFMHADKEDGEETVEDVFNTLTEKQKTVVYALIGQALEDAGAGDEEEMEQSDDFEEGLAHADKEDGEETVEDVFNTLTEKQKTVVYALIGQALEDAGAGDEEEMEGNEDMKHNVFDDSSEMREDVLTHAEMEAIITDAKRYGSMKESAIAHGIEQIDYLFPDFHNLDTPPAFIQRDMGWVSKVMNGVHRTPFSRIKSTFADITEDDARARGYIKGKQKKDEVFSLLKRTTSPTTIYKKQKLDRDDVIDIVDFDVVAWLKGEMRMMLDEEIARAILVGDGRNGSSDDKINEQCIRPIWKDDKLYTIKAEVKTESGASSDDVTRALIKTIIKSRKEYKGSGSPSFYTTEDVLTDMLLLEDGIGRPLYDSVEKLATTLRVKEIITVPVMENLKNEESEPLLGIIVNLADYNVGADRGGAVNMFDDFDIDYNAQKYLIETRCSGALTKPYSAIAFELKQGE